MKHSKTLYAALAALAIITPAQAEEMTEGMYISFDGGVIAVRDADYDYDDGVDQLMGDIDIDKSYQISMALGKQFTDHLRGEVELGYSKSDLDSLSADGFGTFDVTGDLKTVTGLVNGYVDILPGQMINPFVTAGVGLARHTGEITSIAGLGLDDVDGSDTVLAYQVGAGAAIGVAEKTDLQIGYRYQGSSDAKFDDTDIEYGAHVVRAGLKFDF